MAQIQQEIGGLRVSHPEIKTISKLNENKKDIVTAISMDIFLFRS